MSLRDQGQVVDEGGGRDLLVERILRMGYAQPTPYSARRPRQKAGYFRCIRSGVCQASARVVGPAWRHRDSLLRLPMPTATAIERCSQLTDFIFLSLSALMDLDRCMDDLLVWGCVLPDSIGGQRVVVGYGPGVGAFANTA